MESIIKTGFQDLDDLVKGFSGGELILVAGRPAMGKTFFALNIAKKVTDSQGIKTAFISLGLSKEQILERINNSWGEDKFNILIDDSLSCSFEDLADRCRTYKINDTR